MRFVVVLTMLAAAGAGQAHADSRVPLAAPVEGAHWKWAVKPNIMDVGLALGEHVRPGARVGAVGVVECTLGRKRRAENCVLVSETEGSGMGRAMFDIAPMFRAPALDSGGHPTDGRKVRYTLGLGPTAH
jgi:hypothetical protein